MRSLWSRLLRVSWSVNDGVRDSRCLGRCARTWWWVLKKLSVLPRIIISHFFWGVRNAGCRWFCLGTVLCECKKCFVELVVWRACFHCRRMQWRQIGSWMHGRSAACPSRSASPLLLRLWTPKVAMLSSIGVVFQMAQTILHLMRDDTTFSCCPMSLIVVAAMVKRCRWNITHIQINLVVERHAERTILRFFIFQPSSAQAFCSIASSSDQPCLRRTYWA